MNDRTIGYIVIIALVIFLIAPISFLVWRFAIPIQTFVIEFAPITGVAFLNKQDPVYAKGAEFGVVRYIENCEQKVYVTIETRKKMNFFSDYQISVIPKGIMGDRYLEIDPGNENSGPIDPKDTLNGSFVIGPAEALSYVGELRSKVHMLSQLIDKLKTGTIENKSLITDFWEGIETFDSVSNSIAVMSKTLEMEMGQKLDSIVDVLEKTSLIAMRASTLMPSYLKKVENLLTQTNNLVVQLNLISDKSVKVTEQIKNPELFIWSNKLKTLQNELQEVLLIINNFEFEGLKLPIKLNRKGNR